MNREKMAWMISVLLLALLAFQIPSGMAQRDNDYAFVRTLVDIERQVANNYVVPVNEQNLETGAIDGMLGQLDPFSVYIPPKEEEEFDRMLEGNFKGVGIQLDPLPDGRIEVITPIDDSPAFKAGVQAGDIILKVDGQSIEGLKLEDVIKKITGKLGTTVTLRVKHVSGEEADLTMTREEVILPTVKGFARNADNTWDYYCCDNPKIAYIRVTQFTPDTAEKFRAALTPLLSSGLKGLILDLRWNPGGRLDEAEQMVNMLIDHGVIVVTKGRNRPETVAKADGKGTLPYFPMVALVNERSASASEIVSGSLMDNKRALVLGTRTYGKGSVQEVIDLEGNSGKLKLTVAYYYLPSGRLVHRKPDSKDWGVDPQIVVPMDEATEKKVVEDRYEQELFRRPAIKTSTHPVSAEAATQPATRPVDAQLQRAIDALIADTIFRGGPDHREVAVEEATTAPSTRPGENP